MQCPSNLTATKTLYCTTTKKYVYTLYKKVETKPSSRLGWALSASGAVLIENPLWHFNCFHYASIQPTNTNAIRAALLFPFRFQVAYLRFWFATVFRIFRDIFRILKPARERSLPLYQDDARLVARPLFDLECVRIALSGGICFKKTWRKQQKKRTRISSGTCNVHTLFNGQLY